MLWNRLGGGTFSVDKNLQSYLKEKAVKNWLLMEKGQHNIL